MHSYANKKNPSQQNDAASSHGQISDHRSQIIAQRKIPENIDNSPQVKKSAEVQASIDNSPVMVAQRKRQSEIFGNAMQQKKTEEEKPKQLKKDEDEKPKQLKNGKEQAASQSSENKTGLPDQLKSGIEYLSGLEMNDVKVHYNSQEPAQLNALAYAKGNDIHLGAGQEKHLPHEAWHVVQQRQGRVQATTQMKGAAINDDSSLEKEADVMGQKALNTSQPQTGTQRPFNFQTNTIQRYTLFSEDDQKKSKSLGWVNPNGNDFSVAEDGTLAAYSHTKQAWAESSKITASNQILKDQNSDIRLEAGAGEISGKAPANNKAVKKLKAVKVKADTGGKAKLTADCGTAAQETIGIKNNNFTGVSRENGIENYTDPTAYRGGMGINSTSGDMEGEIYKRIMKNEYSQDYFVSLDAMNAFYKLSKSDQDKMSKKYGINAYARAKVGQGLTIGTDSDAKNFDYRGKTAWNFHFATTVFNSKMDDMTIENFTGNAGGDTGWYFVLLGPASKNQDFHFHNGEELGGHGDKYTTLVVDNSANILGEITTDNTHMVGDPAKPEIVVEKLAAGTKVQILKKGINWNKIEITSGGSKGKRGWIMNKYFKN